MKASIFFFGEQNISSKLFNPKIQSDLQQAKNAPMMPINVFIVLILTLSTLQPTNQKEISQNKPIVLYEDESKDQIIIVDQMTKVYFTSHSQSEQSEQWGQNSVHITFKTISGQVDAYLVSEFLYEKELERYRQGSEANLKEEHSDKSEKESQTKDIINYNDENDDSDGWIKNTLLKLQEGLNIVDLRKVREIMQEKTKMNDRIVIALIPKMNSEVVIKLAEPRHGIQMLRVSEKTELELSGNKVHGKIYKIDTIEDYVLRFKRDEGFPQVKVVSCTSNNQIDCIYSPIHIPNFSDQTEKGKILFEVQRMMTQEEEYQGASCAECQIFLLVQSFEGSISMQISLEKVKTAITLQEKEIIREYLRSRSVKEYMMEVKESQIGFVSLKIYEGEMTAQIYDENGLIARSSTRSKGVIGLDIPAVEGKQGGKNRKIRLVASSLEKDTTFSILFSSGEYEIYLRDGETISQEIKEGQKISFYYVNEQLQENNPIYYSLSVDDAKVFSKLNMKIYYWEKNIDGKDEKGQMKEYIPNKPLFDLEEIKSMVLELPGFYPKFLITFENNWNSSIKMDMMINDEEIIFLPLYHNLPLQVGKETHINLLVKNNEEGFIELIIKKCDDSDPSIAYSLDSSDFLNNIYDYESVGESDRITHNSIKVEKGKGLYVRISGDEISNSFIEIEARYMEMDRRKVSVNKLVKGNHGEIKYQLLTDSKAEITFTGLECADGCRDLTEYECVWSTTRADLYRKMICPTSYVIANSGSLEKSQTGIYNIGIKPAHSDNQVSFKHVMSANILYLSIKATHQVTNTEFYYKDIEIVTIEGQLTRLSRDFKKKIAIIAIIVIVLLYLWVSSRSRQGYQQINRKEKKIINKVLRQSPIVESAEILESK